ncbi:hypothetical protein [Winogradskyella ludwigii]|uniref:hypothetical protein n=1 Tax=Winogradskyella ludwigii TaxID=2686076 RepID=UPI0015C9EAE7|nr:hypothetical protein [Winogradskyella ludwigii]
MEYSWIHIFDIFIEGLFLGFGLSIFITFLLTLTKRKLFIDFHLKFFDASISVIKNVGVIYLFYLIFITIKNYSRIKSFLETDEDFFITLFFIFRALLIVLFSQLFWLSSIKKSKYVKSILILFLFILGMFATYIIEKYIILSMDFYRDFLPETSNSTGIESKIFKSIILLVFEKIIIFSSIVFITMFISKKVKNYKNA